MLLEVQGSELLFSSSLLCLKNCHMVRRLEVPLSVELNVWLKQKSVKDHSVKLKARWLEVHLHPRVRLTPLMFVFLRRSLLM